jgi:ferric-dicitrate binding protein FerR (iron transport regulator)
MSPLTSIDPALFKELKAGNERAFERLFRERYTTVLDEALPLLDGNAAAAARGVESAFQRVWKSHDEFTTPDDLEAHIHSAVHEAAARIKSRNEIAHHLGMRNGARARKHTPERAPTADEAWSKVEAALHANVATTTDATHRSHTHPHHEVAAAMAVMEPRRRWGRTIAGGVAFVALATTVAWFGSRPNEAESLARGLASVTARTVVTGAGQLGTVELLDGSTVRMGPESKLRIPSPFGEEVRGLQLDGTATFTVAPNQELRFIVLAGNTTIVASGTSFTVRAYPDEGNVTARVSEGSVTVTVGDSTRTLSAGGALVVRSDSTMATPVAQDLEQALGWADGRVVVANQPLRDVIGVARRWFGMELYVPDTALLSRRVTLNADVGDGDGARRSIESSGNLQRIWVDSTMVLRDRGRRAR